MSDEPNELKTHDWRKTLHIGGIVVVILFVCGVSAAYLMPRLRTVGIHESVSPTPEELLVARVDQATREREGETTRVRIVTTIPGSLPEVTYHAWLYNSAADERRYAGELFIVHDGQYSVTYATQDDISDFDQLHVSTSSDEAAAAATSVLELDITTVIIPSPSPSSTPEPADNLEHE